MFFILFCLAFGLLPSASDLFALVEIHAAIAAFAVFAFVLGHVWPRPQGL
jgi:hypothetical protein